MTDQDAAKRVFDIVQDIKAGLGTEKAVGVIMGAVVGEFMLSGGTKEQVHAYVDSAWDQFQKAKSGG